MPETPQTPLSDRLEGLFGRQAASPDRAMKNFRYVVGAVNGEALKVWEELWKQLEPGVSGVAVSPETSGGFTPACGWPEFLEKFWLLKHYLDYTHRFTQQS